jgi:hypothetical protein
LRIIFSTLKFAAFDERTVDDRFNGRILPAPDYVRRISRLKTVISLPFLAD